MYKIRFIIISLLVLSLAVSSCKKKIDPADPEVEIPRDISQFIWNGMYDYYLWYNDVSKLNPASYPTTDDWYRYLNSFDTDYEALFEDLLYQRDVVDKWSWIVDDWEVQEQSFSGISTSMGYDFRLYVYEGDKIFGYVRYVLPGSPAETAGIERGDIFMKVDGQQLTISNYYSLLFEQVDYELGFAALNGSVPYVTGETVNLSAVVLQEDPVFYADILDIGDNLKTAYLVYNAFTSDFDATLNDAFGYFKSENVDRLILDLRYNGGGSIRSAVHLASMIYSTDITKIFSQNSYNNKLQSYVISEYGVDFVTEYFTNKLDTTTLNYQVMPELPDINSLGLNEVYIIATGSTASASEMIINGLDPYINVIQIGTKTVGKYVGSITVKDYYTYSYLNPDHKWAMQPIVLKIANSAGVSDYIGGLEPDVVAYEYIDELKPFGDPDEPLLAATIDYILGGTKSAGFKSAKVRVDYDFVADSKDINPWANEMYLRYPKFEAGEFFPFSDFKK
ncbi:MAG: S41 family peptidase [Marinilabiliaceae bacterium]|jgi:C-terminal processing protease CtpA/Prc|nr:S41 family peptidase [Marinilabiliaceae bacterium]